MKLIYGCLCEQGADRIKNQDAMFIRHGYIDGAQVCVAAVCDGVGAFENSEMASQVVVGYLSDWFGTQSVTGSPTRKVDRKTVSLLYERLKNSLRECLWQAHQYVMDETERMGNMAAAAVSVMLVLERSYCLYTTGDTRVYESSSRMKQLTADQTADQDGKSRLTYCLGCFPGPNFSRVEGVIHKSATYLLVTDGFYKRLDAVETAGLFKKSKTPAILQQTLVGLRAATLDRGEKDDATVVAVKYI